MTAKLSRWSVGLLCLGLILVLAVPVTATPTDAGRVQTAPGEGVRWIPFGDSRSPGEPSLNLLGSDGKAIDLKSDLPGCLAEDVKAEGQVFTRLFGPGYGFAPTVGLPDLPVLRQGVEIPFGSEVALEIVAAEYADYSLADLGLYPIYPTQPSLPKVPGAQDDQPFAVDRDFYSGGDLYPSEPLALGEIHIVRGHRVQPVEIWPVAYDSAAGTVRLYWTITFRLQLTGSDLGLTEAMAERYASPAFESALSERILNYNQGQGAKQFGPDATVGYLIVTADAYYDAMLPFVTLKQSRGFDVTMTRVSDIPGSGTNTDIKNYIQDAYDTWPTAPSYALLVGDTNTVPGWNSVSAGEITDLYYATMDGSSDWHPDIGRGRFPVRSAGQTTAMVDKYLDYAELTGVEPWLKKAAFIASCDDWQTAEGTHNYVINNYTEPNGYTGIFPNDPEPGGDKIYCVTHGGSTTNITNAANDGRWAIVYSGHGSATGWADGSVSFSQSNVNNLNDYGFYPFVGSHACNTGDFSVTEAYCETWVLQEGKGALVFWGSSDSSYWGEDDVLERGMFDSLFAEGNGHADVTEMTYAGLADTEAAYPSRARYYWETYNVMGDPAVKIFLEPDLPTFTLSVDPTEHEVCTSGSVISSVEIGSILGYAETVYLDTEPLPPGITANFVPDSAPAPFTSELTLDVAPGTPAGDYEITVVATDNVELTQYATINLRVVLEPPDAPVLISPPDGAIDQSFTPTFEWGAVPLTAMYNLQLDRNPLFEAPLLYVPGIPGTSHTPESPLEGGLCYWWQVQGDNACGQGDWAAPFHFATQALEIAFFDNMEAGDSQWAHAASQGGDNWQLSENQSHSPTHAWFVPDDPMVTDSRLWNAGPVLAGSGSTLTFWHRHAFESSYDGGVLEISADGGPWTDLGPYITANGYNGTISNCCGNPLGGRQAWVDDLGSWTQVEADLSSFAGQSVRIRWRLGCDSSVSDEGWYIDDVQITAPLEPNPAPTLLSITPDSGSPDVDTPVQIEGSNFIETPSLRLGNTWLVSVVQVSPTLLTAVVPAGMTEGVYDLVLYNGDCQVATLPDAFTVRSGPYDTMHVDRIRMRYQDRGGSRYLVMAIVRILDQDRQAVPEATVSVEWTLPDASTQAQQADTDARGLARFGIKALQTGSFEVCVTDLVKAGYLYDPGQNRETCQTLEVP